MYRCTSRHEGKVKSKVVRGRGRDRRREEGEREEGEGEEGEGE